MLPLRNSSEARRGRTSKFKLCGRSLNVRVKCDHECHPNGENNLNMAAGVAPCGRLVTGGG
jgi:hypothetical protein